jgi:glutamate N-acetyltransferase/amino-acid N-acetyltransferase
MNPIANGSVTTPAGFTATGVSCNIKQSGNPDLAVILSSTPATIAAAFTINKIVAAPVVLGRELIARQSTAQAILVNSGNANACTGQQGIVDATAMADYAAAALDIAATDVLVSSTGLIGEPLPMDKVLAGIDAAVAGLTDDGGEAAATAIMTTDTVPKSIAVSFDLDGIRISIGGTAKGAGMIAPHMVTAAPHATMLAYLTTDADVEASFLRTCLGRAVQVSFNAITIDGDMSTNDTVAILANGLAGNPGIVDGSVAADQFQAAVTHICTELAKMIVRDGEGATRFVELTVTGAANENEARQCAGAIANSALCKTAWFGGDPNWGRILATAGRAGVQINPSGVMLRFGDLTVLDGGTPQPQNRAALAAAVDKPEIDIVLDLGVGDAKATVWTCDLTYDYIKINAEYHT